jgi:hypothetical protein
MIDVTCRCGHISHSEEQHIGKHLRCPKCGEPVPILRAARAMVQPSTAPPHSQTHQPRARRVRRFRPLYAVGVAIAVMVLAGSWLVAHFESVATDKKAGSSSVSEAGGTPSNQKQPGDSQASNSDGHSPQFEVSDIEPTPPKPRRTIPSQVPQEGSSLEQEPSLPNGARIAPDIGTDGHGELKVDNGTAEDAEIILYNVERDEKSRDQNVRAHNLLQMTGIPIGTYELKYRLGPSYYRFERSLNYTEERTRGEDGVWVNYHQIGVTLHSVVGGNARTKPISRDEFLKGRTPTARPLKAQTTEQ